jgi:tetratricopeptide (TPR) repeat protein
MRRRPLIAALFAGLLIALGTGCDYLGARDQLNKGVAAMKGAKYKEATEHFKQAIAKDPDWDVPQLYLAITYMTQWIPGAKSPENKEFADQARAGFQKVLERDGGNNTALASMASMALSEATNIPPGSPPDRMAERDVKLNEAAQWNEKRVAASPNAEAYYSLGVISYHKWLPEWQAARAASKMGQEVPGPLSDKKVREELRTKYSTLVDSSIANLKKSLELDPEYENAMTYMNIMTRLGADYLDDKAEYDKKIAEADDWIAKALEIRKIKAEREAKKASGGVHQE